MSSNGKLIYQLTSASALKETDMFPISTSNNLTRKVTLSQVRTYLDNFYYEKDEVNDKLDELRSIMKNMSDSSANLDNTITELRNEFNLRLSNLESEINNKINNIESELNTKFETLSQNVENELSDMDTKITNLNTSLSKTISDLDTKLTNSITTVNNLSNSVNNLENTINNLITVGTDIPTTLASGKFYLQYF